MLDNLLHGIGNAIGGAVHGVEGLFGGNSAPPQAAPKPVQAPQQVQQVPTTHPQQTGPNLAQLSDMINQATGFQTSQQKQQLAAQPQLKPNNSSPIIRVAQGIGATAQVAGQDALHQVAQNVNKIDSQGPVLQRVNGKNVVNQKALGQQINVAAGASDSGGAGKVARGVIDDAGDVLHPALVKAAQDLSDFYNAKRGPSEDVSHLLLHANGDSQTGARLSGQFGKAIKTALPSPKSRELVTHVLDGSVDPTTVSPEVRGTAKTLAGLNGQGIDIRKLVDPGVQRVENYATRLTKGISKPAGPAQNFSAKIRGLSDLFNTDSRFNQSRTIKKYVAPDGETKIGDPKSLGLKETNNGSVVDDSGKVFTPQKTNIQEIEASGAAKYEKDAAKVSSVYHNDTTRLKARNDGISSLLQNASHYGLDNGQDGTIPAGYQEIKNVPELEGYSASPKTAKMIDDHFKIDPKQGLFGRTWQGLNNIVTQFIVMNPAIHGANLATQSAIESGNMPLFKGSKIQAGPVGVLRSGVRGARAFVQPAYREKLIRSYLADGGHIESYGANQRTIISKALDSLHLPEVNKLNSKAMAGIDGVIRASLHEANKAAGVSAKDSVKGIDTFLGKQEHMGAVAKNIGMFYHWLKTQVRSIGTQATHPIANAGANVNTAVLAAATMWGTQKAWQEWTGNPNAHVRVPGELGLAQEVAEAPGQLSQGQAPSVLTNHLNPTIQALANQAYGKTLFDNQPITNRASQLGQDLVAPSAGLSKVASGAHSPLEEAANLNGLYTPHVKGAPAAPNIPAFNTKGAVKAQGADPTGIQQASAYYKSVAKAQQGLIPGSKAANLVQTYFSSNYTVGGQKVKAGTVGGYASAKSLTDGPQGAQALSRVYQAEHSQKGNDPLWSLPLNAPAGKPSVSAYLKVESQYQGPEKDGAKQKAQGSVNKGWITDLQTTRNAYFNRLPPSKSGAAQEPAYPVFNGQTTADMNTASNIGNSAQYGKFLDSHPDVVDAQANLAKWTNQIRQLEGAPSPLPATQQETPMLKQIIDTYNALPASKSGGNTNPATSGERSAWIKANPVAYNAMSNFYAQSSMTSLLKNSVEAVYSGQDGTSQAVLKAAKSAGQDVNTNADGTLSIGTTGQPGVITGDSDASTGSGSSGGDSGYIHLKFPKAKNLGPLKAKAGSVKHVTFKFKNPKSGGAASVVPGQSARPPQPKPTATKAPSVQSSNDKTKSGKNS